MWIYNKIKNLAMDETPLAQIASSRRLFCLYYNSKYSNFAPHQNVLLIEKLNKEIE